MESGAKTEEVIDINYLDALATIQPLPHCSYNIDLPVIDLDDSFNENFANICHILKTTTTVTELTIYFTLDATNLKLLTAALTENQSIARLLLTITQPIDAEAIQHFSSEMKRNKVLKHFTIRVTPTENPYQEGAMTQVYSIMDSIKYFRMPYLKLTLEYCQSWLVINTNEFHLKQIELLQTMNINKIEWSDTWSLLPGRHPLSDGAQGFEKFCETLIKTDRIKSFNAHHYFFDDSVLPYLVKFIAASKNLRELSIDLPPEAPSKCQDLLTALATSQIRLLALNGFTTMPETWESLAEAIKSMKNLTKLCLLGELRMAEDATPFLQIISQSESLRSIELNARYGQADLMKQKAKLTQRNRKFQNSRVRALITVLFNIARDTSSSTTLPRDIWSIIMSFVRVPGVSLDFGRIAQSIFKDSTVRRVIYKSIKE